MPQPTPGLAALRLFLFCLLLSLAHPVAAAEKSAPPLPDLDTMLGQMVFVGFKGMDVGDPEMAAFLDSLSKGHVGGVILFEPDFITQKPRNITSVQQVAALAADLQERSPTPLFVAVDQEGGTVQRFREQHGMTQMPSARVMGRDKPEHTLQWALTVGRELRAAGINVNFAPVLDVDINPQSKGLGVRERPFSPHAEQVIAHAAAFAEGMHTSGIVVVYKHFPGQGSATADTHFGTSDITNTCSPVELEPYKALFRRDFPAMVLTSSMLHRGFDATYPCSLAPAVVQGLLRKELGWQGVTLSGDIQMQAVSDRFDLDEALLLALKAGQDIPLVPNNMSYHPDMAEKIFQRLRHLVNSGAISRQQVESSYQRIMALKQKAGIL